MEINEIIGYVGFALTGYVLGSILFAKIWGYVFTGKDITINPKDHNPGTFNAFVEGGFLCGTLTVIGDVLKGFIPVFLCVRIVDSVYSNELFMALVVVAPVIGHVLPVFFKFKGGKGIAVSFGSLLGFAFDIKPAIVLALVFILFSVVIVIKPDYYKTLVTYIVASIAVVFTGQRMAVMISYIAITAIVCIKLALGDEQKDALTISIFRKQLYSRNKKDEKEL